MDMMILNAVFLHGQLSDFKLFFKQLTVLQQLLRYR